MPPIPGCRPQTCLGAFFNSTPNEFGVATPNIGFIYRDIRQSQKLVIPDLIRDPFLASLWIPDPYGSERIRDFGNDSFGVTGRRGELTFALQPKISGIAVRSSPRT